MHNKARGITIQTKVKAIRGSPNIQINIIYTTNVIANMLIAL